MEEVGVGTPWWLLALAFGILLPVCTVLVEFVLHIARPTGQVVSTALLGVAVGLILRLLGRERERYRANAVDRASDIRALRKLSWGDFEVVVGEVIRRQGFVVKERGGFRADGGVDLIAEGRTGRIAVQCKHWQAWSVGASRVRDLYGTVKAGGFAEGWLVTTGVFTRPATTWASGKELRLIDGSELAKFVVERPTEPPVTAEQASTGAPSLPACPNCGQTLMRMRNKADGTPFWGCTLRSCNWTFNDAPASLTGVTCDRGHPMVPRRTRRGVQFWGCSAYPGCGRKRLWAATMTPPAA